MVFLGTRLAGLAKFPIFFFCDEAILNVRAAEFLHDGLRDGVGHRFPIYFDNLGQFNMGGRVYTQILPLILFGRSIFVTRLTEVLVALSRMVAVNLILKQIVLVRFWWAGVLLLLSIAPSWFLHRRTAFGCSMAGSYYAWCLSFSLRYRYHRPRSLFPCLLFGALSFYRYSAERRSNRSIHGLMSVRSEIFLTATSGLSCVWTPRTLRSLNSSS